MLRTDFRQVFELRDIQYYFKENIINIFVIL